MRQPVETLAYLMLLAKGDPAREIRIRAADWGDYDACVELLYLEFVEDRVIDHWPGSERVYRLTKRGYDYLKASGYVKPKNAKG